MDKVVFTLTLALIGGFIGNELKIPAGALLGAMTFVGAANIMGAKPEMPESFNTLAQIVLGGFLGLAITKEVLAGLKNYIIPSLLVVVFLAVFGVLTGFIVNKITGIDLYTSLFGSVPGGMQEMIILSESYDVNHPAVVVIQTVRRVLIVIIYPLLVFIVSKYMGHSLNMMGK
ncbi:MAG TPA: AbrB family transcriptional regulator [Thermoanaerobacterales bacterium]|nr:AbrB family transcriptional regulator [Thermoanaerobacterales bacterium]